MNNRIYNNFWKYYNKWKEETAFRSTGNFNNENFEALCDPNKVELKEMIEGAFEILSERDDFIVHALDKYFEKLLGEPMITYTGYVPLSNCCNGWKTILALIKSDNLENFDEKNFLKNFEISEE